MKGYAVVKKAPENASTRYVRILLYVLKAAVVAEKQRLHCSFQLTRVLKQLMEGPLVNVHQSWRDILLPCRWRPDLTPDGRLFSDLAFTSLSYGAFEGMPCSAST